MSFLSLVLALFAEQVRPFVHRDFAVRLLQGLCNFLEHHLNAGGHHHGVVAWWIFALLTAGLTALAGWLMGHWHAVASLGFNVAVLYVCMGFRQSSARFSTIKRLLEAGDLAAAQALAGPGTGADPSAAPDAPDAPELVRRAIQEALRDAHRHVLAVLLWFAVFGPGGAALYRVALFARDHLAPRVPEFSSYANRAFAWIDWLPRRASAAAFAVVGNFEDAVFCWRAQAGGTPFREDPTLGPIICSGAGAVGIKLGPEIGCGSESDVGALTSIHGLIWRALLLALFVVLLMGFAKLVG